MKQIVCNASPLITLAKGGLLYALPDQFGKIICPRAVVKEYTVRAFGFHALRRYVATYLSDKEKIATKTIQKILGHTSEATTERYLYNAHKDLEAVMELLANSKGDIEGGNQYDTKNEEA